MKMTPTEQQIQELRNAFLQKLEKDGTPDIGGFHEADLNRIKNTDKWLKRFLEHNDNDLNLSLNMLWETCEWRKQFGTNDITENNIKMDIIYDGGFFSHGRDVDGKALLIFKSKKHVKGQKDISDLKRCLVYWLDRLERESDGDLITIFFDMADTGLNNMDMDFTKYIISLFKQYFPHFLNYIVIFEMPWILNAAFKVIKALLPAKAVAKMKFVNKSTLKEVVTPDQALVCWGGHDTYEFSFVSEVRKDNIYNPQSKLLQGGEISASKKVHFAEGSSTADSIDEAGDKSDEMLHVTPCETITFQREGGEMIGTITITNKDTGSITYKIKTTSPEKFRVRPSTGPLTPGASVTITVSLQPGYHSTGLVKDKFLVMGIALPTNGQGEMSAQELAEIWKNPADYNVEQHRLKCILPGLPEHAKNGSILNSEPDSKQNMSNVLSKLTQVIESNNKLQAQVNFVQTLQWILMLMLLLFAVAFMYILKNQPNTENDKGHCTSNIDY